MLLPGFPQVLLLSLQNIWASGLRKPVTFGARVPPSSSLSTALNHSPAASAGEIPVAAALASAGSNLATVPVLQNVREMVVAMSPQVMSLFLFLLSSS